MLNISYFCDCFAVVPVFVNTGAALLPALVAGLASFAALLFKPRLLLRTCWEKPYWPLGIAVAAVALWLVFGWFAGSEPATVTAQESAAPTLMQPADWVQLAKQLARSKPSAATNGAPNVEAAPSEAKPLSLAGGNNRCGYLGGPSPIKLQKLWEFSEYGAMFLSSPLVRGDRVHGAYCLLDPPGSYGAVMCLDAATGEHIWLTDLKDAQREFKGFFSSPAITADGNSLVIGQGLHPDYDSELVCLDTETGSVKWLIECPLHIESSPAIAGDVVVVGAGAVEDPNTHKPKGSSDPKKDKNPGFVFAASISTGKELWRHVLNDPESSPAIEDGVVYIGSGFNGQAVAALRLNETDEELKSAGLQREIWKTPTPFPATGAITLAGDLVLVGCGNGDYVFQAPDPAGAVLALDKKTGQIKWKVAMPDGVLGPVAVSGNKAIVPIRNGEIVALEMPNDGGQPNELWRTTARDDAKVLAGCAVTDSHVYVMTHDGFLVVLDAANGKQIESHYVNGDPGEMGMTIASPLVAGGRVYVGSETGGLRCYGGTSDVE